MLSITRQIYINSIENIGNVLPINITQIHKNRPYSGLVFFTDGENEFIFEEHTVKMSPGKILYLPEGCSYRVHKTNSSCIAINFRINNCNEPDFIHTPKNIAKFEELFAKAEYFWRTRPAGYYSKCMANIYSILHLIENESQAAYTTNSNAAKLSKAIDYIHNNYTTETISIEYLAQISNMSATYFRKLFKQVYGTSPITYVINMKIQRAKEMLRSKMYTVEQVAALSGYNDPSFFRREFKKYTDMTPTEYISKH